MGKNSKRKERKTFVDPMSVTWAENYDETFSRFWKKVPAGVGKCLATLAVFIVGISINVADKMGKNPKRKEQKKFVDPMSVTWAENYDETFSRVWSKLPAGVGKCFATVAVFLLGISINGDWINIIIHVGRQFGYIPIKHSSLESLKLQGLWTFMIGSCAVSYGLYFSIGGFLHWYYYVRQRDRAEEWKCQPKKWLSPELERHEIMLGSFTLFLNASTSAVLACYITNGGYSTVYYEISDYGWTWFFLQFAVIFIYQDYATYWIHRTHHLPFLYKYFHKLHHKYKQPTAFSVTAIHPVESLHIQCTLIIPLFVLPVHWLSFYMVALYTYYHGIIDHSGINFKGQWWQPWQPDAIFHDNHHQYFHVNFAFNIEYWDKLHGTYRQKDRIYRENIFYGIGKSITDISPEELDEEIEERESENPLAYHDNKMVYKLEKNEVKNLKLKNKKKKKKLFI